MKKMFSTKMVIVLIVFYLLMTVPISQADSVSLKYDLNITNAYYADLDKDGLEDDIFVDYTLKIRCDDDDDQNYDYNSHQYDFDDDICDNENREVYNLKTKMQFDLKIELILPSALKRVFFLNLEYSLTKEYKETVHLYNNVTESGWYTAKLTLYHQDNHYEKLAYDVIYFDPPMATQGTQD